jgi:Protein of unknown function (DUF992)
LLAAVSLDASIAVVTRAILGGSAVELVVSINVDRPRSIQTELDMHRPLSVIATLAFVAAVASPVPTLAQGERIKAGTLTCDISGGIGLIITSHKDVTCMFTPSQPGPREVYVGGINKFGLDVGATAGGEMVWAVYAPTTRRFGALAGNYSGATAEATVGAGLGANVLVGGSDRTVALQPLSVQGQAGLNVAAGVAELILRPAR